MATNQSGTYVYVTNSGDGTVSVIDTSTNTVVGSPINVGRNPRWVASNPSGSLVYVSNGGDGSGGDNRVFIINTSTNQVVGTLTAGTSSPSFFQGLGGLVVNSTGTSLYVANDYENTVWVFPVTP